MDRLSGAARNLEVSPRQAAPSDRCGPEECKHSLAVLMQLHKGWSTPHGVSSPCGHRNAKTQRTLKYTGLLLPSRWCFGALWLCLQTPRAICLQLCGLPLH